VIIFRYLVLVHGPAYLRKFYKYIITCEPLWVMGGRGPSGGSGAEPLFRFENSENFQVQVARNS